MVEIFVERDDKGRIQSFLVKGHAFFAKKGEDIVCSAVSAICYTTIGALENLAGGCFYKEEDGRMYLSHKRENVVASDKKTQSSEKQREVAYIVLQTAYIGFLQIENSYGNYVRVFEKEV
jgi:uncharacterized protein